MPTNDWNEPAPAGLSLIAQGAAVIRQLKQDVRERLVVLGVKWGESAAEDGKMSGGGELASTFASYPTGSILPFAGLTIPTGWILIDGVAKSRATYPALFASKKLDLTGSRTNGSPIVTGLSSTTRLNVGYYVEGTGIPVGTKTLTVDSPTQVTLNANATSTVTGVISFNKHGFGDGVTTFDLPDPRGREWIGANAAHLPGTTVGVETVMLTTLNLPTSHNHPGSTGVFSGNALTTNIQGFPTWGDVHRDWLDPDQPWINASLITGSGNHGADYSPSGSVGLIIVTQGGDGAHNNVGASFAEEFIIKT